MHLHTQTHTYANTGNIVDTENKMANNLATQQTAADGSLTTNSLIDKMIQINHN